MSKKEMLGWAVLGAVVTALGIGMVGFIVIGILAFGVRVMIMKSNEGNKKC